MFVGTGKTRHLNKEIYRFWWVFLNIVINTKLLERDLETKLVIAQCYMCVMLSNVASTWYNQSVKLHNAVIF